MTSPRELDCTNTHTHLTGNRMNPWAILGSVQHHPSSTPQAPSLPKITWCGHDRPTHPSGSEGSLGGFLYTPVSGSIHPRVLLLHPHCTFLPRALHSSALQDDLCCFLLAVQWIKSFRDWVEPELPPPSLTPGSGRRSQWSARPDQLIPCSKSSTAHVDSPAGSSWLC